MFAVIHPDSPGHGDVLSRHRTRGAARRAIEREQKAFQKSRHGGPGRWIEREIAECEPKASRVRRQAVVAIAALLALNLAGCATVHQTYAPDGRKAYSLNCSGLARGWDKCLSAAGELCGAAGYNIVDRSSEGLLVAGGGLNESGGSGFVGSTRERAMLVACRD